MPNLTGKSTAVKLDSGFTTALTTLGLTPSMLGTGTLTDGSVVFPITGGHVEYYKKGVVNPYVQGEIDHQGSGLQLAAGATSVELQNFVVNPGNSKLYGDVSVDGQPYASDVYLFNLDGSTLQPLQADAADGTAVLTGTRVLVSPDAAAALTRCSAPPPSRPACWSASRRSRSTPSNTQRHQHGISQKPAGPDQGPAGFSLS